MYLLSLDDNESGVQTHIIKGAKYKISRKIHEFIKRGAAAHCQTSIGSPMSINIYTTRLNVQRLYTVLANSPHRAQLTHKNLHCKAQCLEGYIMYIVQIDSPQIIDSLIRIYAIRLGARRVTSSQLTLPKGQLMLKHLRQTYV